MGILGLFACGGTFVPAVSAPVARDEDAGGTVTATGGDGEPDPADVFADAPIDLALDLPASSVAGLAESADDDVDDVPATLTYAGRTWTVGVRLKGGVGSFRTFDEKPAFRVDVDEYDADARFAGARRLNLQNMVQDGAMLADHAAYALWDAFGVPVPRHGYARLTVNGQPYGLYGLTDAVAQDLMDLRFADGSGALFEGEMDDFDAGEWETFDVVLDGGLADPLALVEDATAALDAAPPAGRAATLGEQFDLDEVLSALAVELVTGNPDAYTTWTNNFYVYDDPATSRLVLVEWGPDQAFSSDLDVLGDWPGRLYSDCRADPTCDAELRGRLADVAGAVDDPAWRAWIEGVAAATRTDCEQDPRSEMDCDAERTDFFAFLDRRAAAVLAALEAG